MESKYISDEEGLLREKTIYILFLFLLLYQQKTKRGK